MARENKIIPNKKFFEIDDDTPNFAGIDKVSPVVRKLNDRPERPSFDEPAIERTTAGESYNAPDIGRNHTEKQDSTYTSPRGVREISIAGQKVAIDESFFTSKTYTYE